jgi:integrase
VTDAFLRSVKPPKTGRLEIPDSRVPGLVVRVTQTGAISYSFRKMLRGRHLRLTVGQWPLGIADARKLALAALVAFQRGEDPAADRRAARAAVAPPTPLPTVKQRLDEWQSLRDRAWSYNHAVSVARMVRHDILPTLGDRALTGTTRADWVAVVNATRARSPSMAALLYRVAGAFLGYAEAAGWLEHALLPRRGAAVLAPPPRPRDRVLDDGELASVWHATGDMSIRYRALVRLLILTGTRLREVAGIRPAEIDTTAALWKLPGARAKNGQGYTIPLCRLALTELDACNHRPITGGFAKLKHQLDERSGVSGWRLHDLRRTCRTGLSRSGVAREIAEACINHRATGLVATYDRHDFALEVLTALRQWQQHVAELVAS